MITAKLAPLTRTSIGSSTATKSRSTANAPRRVTPTSRMPLSTHWDSTSIDDPRRDHRSADQRADNAERPDDRKCAVERLVEPHHLQSYEHQHARQAESQQ